MKGADRGRQALIEHGLLQLRRRQHLQGDVNVGGARLEAADGGGQATGRVGQGIVDDADLQFADQAAAQRAGAGAELLEGAEELQAGLVDGAALVGEAEADPAALAEAHAQPRLEVGEQRADARRAEIELGLGGREAAGLDDGQEHAQQLDVGVGELGQHGQTGAGALHSDIINRAFKVSYLSNASHGQAWAIAESRKVPL